MEKDLLIFYSLLLSWTCYFATVRITYAMVSWSNLLVWTISWQHLPKSFCSQHLPNHDATVVLVDEWANEYETSYLLYRHGLSAGWRGFSVSHRLLKGDILIFELIEPCKLKVIVSSFGVFIIDLDLKPIMLAFCFTLWPKWEEIDSVWEPTQDWHLEKKKIVNRWG